MVLRKLRTKSRLYEPRKPAFGVFRERIVVSSAAEVFESGKSTSMNTSHDLLCTRSARG